MMCDDDVFSSILNSSKTPPQVWQFCEGRRSLYKPFYQAGRSWRSKPDRVDSPSEGDMSRFRPPGFKGFLEKRRKESAMFPPYVNIGLRQESVKELIQKGKFLNAALVPNENPYERNKREGQLKDKNSQVSIMNEITSVEVLPIIRKSRTIECQRDVNGIVNCHQDDLQYKIRLKHPDLPQEILETLITNLYSRLFKVTTEKKKRDEIKSVQNPSLDSPFVVVLPPDHLESRAGQTNKCKIHSSSTEYSGEDLIIECSPAEMDDFKGSDKFNTSDDEPKSYVYSCRWHGKRSAEQQKIIVEKVRRGPPLQSFKVLIDPAQVGFNLLPITVLHK